MHFALQRVPFPKNYWKNWKLFFRIAPWITFLHFSFAPTIFIFEFLLKSYIITPVYTFCFRISKFFSDIPTSTITISYSFSALYSIWVYVIHCQQIYLNNADTKASMTLNSFRTRKLISMWMISISVLHMKRLSDTRLL